MTQVTPEEGTATGSGAVLWYALDGGEVATTLGVDPSVGLSSERAATLLAAHGPNAFPEENPKPGWRRFVDHYRTYM